MRLPFEPASTCAKLLIAFLPLFVLWGCDDDRELPCPPGGCTDAGNRPDGDIEDGGLQWPDRDPGLVPECSQADQCIIAINFNYCCPCPLSMPRSRSHSSPCVISATDTIERPDECGLGCHNPELCEPCPQTVGVACGGGSCRTLYEGDCHPDALDSCGEGEVCDLVDGIATCIEASYSCSSDADCEDSGWTCRDWRSEGTLFCWSPESTCFDDLSCPDNNYCLDDNGDGVYLCVDVSPLCRSEAPDDCPIGAVCIAGDSQGRGICESP